MASHLNSPEARACASVPESGSVRDSGGCPLCDSSGTREIQSFQTESVIRRWQELYQIDVRPEFSGVSSFTLRRCQRCGLGYFWPSSVCGSPRLYACLQKFPWYYIPGKWEHAQGLRDIDGCKTVLEIASGLGDFIKLARGTLGIQIKGLERNPLAIEEARVRGIQLEETDLAEVARGSSGTFDAVCCFQGLEHVPCPKEFLRHCCELLAPSGRLILGLPNADSFLRLQSNVLDLPPHHCSRWLVSTIRYLPALYPLRLLRLAFEPLMEYHAAGYVEAQTDRWARIFPAANHPRVQSRLTRFLLRTGMHKHVRGMTVYAAFEKLSQ